MPKVVFTELSTKSYNHYDYLGGKTLICTSIF